MAAGYATQGQAYQALIAAGAPPGVASILAAVTRPESSGYTAARNDYKGNSYLGLWQVGSMHGFDNARLQSDDINYQAMAAYKVYQEQGFGAWETYSSGAYKQYMNGDNSPALSDSTAATLLQNQQQAASGQPIDRFQAAALGLPWQGIPETGKSTLAEITTPLSQPGAGVSPIAAPDTGATAIDAPGGPSPITGRSAIDGPGENGPRGNPIDAPLAFDHATTS